MIATKDSIQPQSTDQWPNSRRVYVEGCSGVRVPFREIPLAGTKSLSGRLEPNEPFRVYDTSGPWGDPDFHGDVAHGLPKLRSKWILARGDVAPQNNNRGEKPLRARPGQV